MHDELHPESVAVRAGRPARTACADEHGIALSATFHHGPTTTTTCAAGNETIGAFESALGALEGGTALAFGSGMAA